MNDRFYMDASGARAANALLSTELSVQFTVVDAGNGQIALHSSRYNRFVRMNDQFDMDASIEWAADALPSTALWERFTVVNEGMQIALHSPVHNRFVRINDKLDMDTGTETAANALPSNWLWERFTPVVLQKASFLPRQDLNGKYCQDGFLFEGPKTFSACKTACMEDPACMFFTSYPQDYCQHLASCSNVHMAVDNSSRTYEKDPACKPVDCVFPFEYNGVQHNSCTEVGTGKLDYRWCSTSEVYNGTPVICTECVEAWVDAAMPAGVGLGSMLATFTLAAFLI